MPPAASRKRAFEDELTELVQSCYHDPLKFVLKCFPWGEPGTMLEHHKGPDTWQVEALKRVGEETRARHFDGHTPVMPVRLAVSKGHGVGGSVLLAMLTMWIMSTRPNAHGTLTANTATQLDTKTWATLMRWKGLCLCGHWFTINRARMYHANYPTTWFCTPQTCAPENSEAFAGQHAADSSSFYGFDEDSNIAEIVHEVSEGGLATGEPFVFRLGNPTRNQGSFYAACFGKTSGIWKPIIVDSRTSRFSNKALIQSWVDEHGEDSDFVRVRVRGLPPRASDLQFIDQDRITAARTREVTTFEDEPLVAGVDFSGGGKAMNIVAFRRGADARSRKAIRVPGEATRKDRSAFLSVLAEILAERRPERRVTMMFCDSAYGAPYVVALKAMGHQNVMEITAGDTTTPDPVHLYNVRSLMWSRGKEWLLTGATADEDRLAEQLGTPGHHVNVKNQLVIESKESMAKRNAGLLDEADAFLLTFAMPVIQTWKNKPKRRRARFSDRRNRPSGQGSGGLGWLK